MKPPTIREMIASMGYCCPSLFFRLFPSTQQVALRLGVSRRAIKYAKARARMEGCAGCSNCQLPLLSALEHAVLQRLPPRYDPPPIIRPTSPPVESPPVLRRGAIDDPSEDD